MIRPTSVVLSLTLLVVSYAVPRVLAYEEEKPRALRVVSVHPLQEWNRFFTESSTWRGSDGAYSIPVSDEKTLWLFGDSFIAQKKKPKLSMINNSAAWQSWHWVAGANSDWHLRRDPLQYFWNERGGKPDSLLKPGDKGWYWPGDGFVLSDKLYLFMKHNVSTKEGPPTFRFDWDRNDLIVISNYLDAPTRWQSQSVDLPEGYKKLLFGVACLREDEYCYVYCSVPGCAENLAPHPVMVTRIKISDLKKLDMKSWQYYCSGDDGKPVWKSDFAVPYILFKDAAPEMTVTRLGGITGYVCTYMPPLSDKIMMRRADKPEGPWSEPVLVYQCPEAKERVLGSNVMVYSAKAHEEQLHTGKEMLVTYCSNPGDLAQYNARPDLYFPHWLIVKLDLQ